MFAEIFGTDPLVLYALNCVVRELGWTAHCHDCECSGESHDVTGKEPGLILYIVDGKQSAANAETILEQFPDARVVLFLADLKGHDLFDKFPHVVMGAVARTASPEQIKSILLLVASGNVVLPASWRVSACETPKPSNSCSHPRSQLTGREQEVLAEVALGRSNKVIAANLAISQYTVEVHMTSIFRKMNVKNRTEAAMHASEHIASNLPQHGAAPADDWTGATPAFAQR